MKNYTDAVVRSLPDSFDRCIRPADSTAPIDVALARTQHDTYVDLLSRLGLVVHRIDADERFPDCCFVEDPAIVVGNIAILCEMAAPARRGEGEAVARALSRYHALRRLGPPAFIDGGDVIRAGDRLFVGLSERTNAEAVQQLRYFLGDEYAVMPVEVRDVLHLKSACTAIDAETLLIDPTKVDPVAFDGFELIEVPEGESYAANCLAVNGAVVVSAGFPRTSELVASTGYEVIELSMSEFRKAGGSLTCLSILW